MKNFYALNPEPDYSFKSKHGRGYKTGPLCALFAYALSKTHLPVREGVNCIRAIETWERGHIGFVKQEEWLYTVHWKPFKKWVARNIPRILDTAKEVKKEIARRNEEYERDYRKMIEEDYMREIYEANNG
jgi:hypothetical protein